MKTKAAGTLISFEGGDGSGKSTCAAWLAAQLAESGRSIVLTREPGATPIGQELRRLLLFPQTALTPLAELLLYAADRAQHVTEVIATALARGAVVICDRYADSTLAYQGGGRSHPPDLLRQLNAIACQGVYPDRTYFLDVPVATGLARVRKRGGLDTFEQEEVAFHQRVLDTYRGLAMRNENLQRWVIINATQELEAVQAALWEDCQELLTARRVA